jgi:hypothetical protein
MKIRDTWLAYKDASLKERIIFGVSIALVQCNVLPVEVALSFAGQDMLPGLVLFSDSGWTLSLIAPPTCHRFLDLLAMVLTPI